MLLAACASTSPSPIPTPTPTIPGAIRWTRGAAEHRALFLELYRRAAERIDQLAGAQRSAAWGVILDADETVLDNSPYELERATLDSGFTAASWSAWVRRAAAPALPGAAAFIAHVRALGGHAVIVTNRAEVQCDDTRANLRALGIAVDAVLCQQGKASDKNPRFEAVRRGTAGLPPLTVLMWVGDNIQDFPRLSQSIRGEPDSAFAMFGDRYIVLPNPMYGSWEKP
jgi:5'-nucleotidase (lipoprotein e(P4) family)